MCAPGIFHPNQYLLLNGSYENQGFCSLLILILTLNSRFISVFLKLLVWSVCTMHLWLQNWHSDICYHSNKFGLYA